MIELSRVEVRVFGGVLEVDEGANIKLILTINSNHHTYITSTEALPVKKNEGRCRTATKPASVTHTPPPSHPQSTSHRPCPSSPLPSRIYLDTSHPPPGSAAEKHPAFSKVRPEESMAGVGREGS